MTSIDGLVGSVLCFKFVFLFCCCGFLALQANYDNFEPIIGITCKCSMFKRFEGKALKEIITKLIERFCPVYLMVWKWDVDWAQLSIL